MKGLQLYQSIADVDISFTEVGYIPCTVKQSRKSPQRNADKEIPLRAFFMNYSIELHLSADRYQDSFNGVDAGLSFIPACIESYPKGAVLK